MMETTISDFHTSLYTPAIQKLAFHLPHVCILGKNHCGEIWRTAFKICELFQDILCRHNYSERVFASFDHQIKSEYYGGNISVSIEGILLQHFSALPKTDTNSTTPSRQRHALFHSFYLTIENRILPLILHTTSVWFHFSKKKNYWQHNWVQYGKTLMEVPNNIDMLLQYTICRLCLIVTPS